MPSSISSKYDIWFVQNIMFWKILGMASRLGQKLAENQAELDWVERLSQLDEAKAGTFSPDFSVDELFSGPKEAGFWAKVLFELADQIYRRTIGDQEKQDWQVPTIWAAYDLGLLLHTASKQDSWDA